MSNHGVVAYADTLHNAYMKMETVEHFAQIALVTHLLGRQQPLEGQDLEKLLLARGKYQGSHSLAPMPLACGIAADSHRNRLEHSATSRLDDTNQPEASFRGRARAKN
jgi:hypothetical protein